MDQCDIISNQLHLNADKVMVRSAVVRFASCKQSDSAYFLFLSLIELMPLSEAP